MNRRRFLALASVGATGGILTACGNDPEATNLTPTRIADAINAPTLATNATPPGGETAGGGGGGGPEQTKIDVSTVDLKFEPSSFSIPADTDVTVTVTNHGALQHDFHIEQLDLTTKLLNAGESDTLTFKASAGTLDFWCTVPGHK
ncbi:MAG: cupredoxin domain-containing protein, partial [Thermomicrobiales bacterium]